MKRPDDHTPPAGLESPQETLRRRSMTDKTVYRDLTSKPVSRAQRLEIFEHKRHQVIPRSVLSTVVTLSTVTPPDLSPYTFFWLTRLRILQFF